MADEERGKELPQRVRGATRAAPATSVTSPSALSDELRQRMQASQDTRVACDRVTCAALTARGFPAHELLVVGPASGDPFRSAAVAVETPAVLSMLGSSLATGWTPDVLASFGSGRPTPPSGWSAPHGAAAYRTSQNLDLAARKTAGAALLNDSQINVPALAGLQLAAGQVDSRVLLALADLAGQQPISIVQFGNDGPGASTDLPLRFVDLAEECTGGSSGPRRVREVGAGLPRPGEQQVPSGLDDDGGAGERAGRAAGRLQRAEPVRGFRHAGLPVEEVTSGVVAHARRVQRPEPQVPAP